MINIKYRQEAILDIQSESNYIYLQTIDKKSDEKFLHEIEKSIKTTKDFPLLGKELIINGITTNFRYIVSDKNYIFYEYLVNTEEILINSVINTRRDYISILRNNELL